MTKAGYGSVILGTVLVLAAISACGGSARGQDLEPWAQEIARLGPPCSFATTGIKNDGWFTTCVIETVGERYVYWVVLVKRLPDPEAAAREYRHILTDNTKTWTPFHLPNIDEGISRESVPKEPGLVSTETTQWHRFRTGVFVVRIRRLESGIVVLPPPRLLPRIVAILKAASPAVAAAGPEAPIHNVPPPPEHPTETTAAEPLPATATIEPSSVPSGTAPTGSWLSDPDVRRAVETAIPAILGGVVAGIGAALANALAGARGGAIGQSLSELIRNAGRDDPFKSWMQAGVTKGGVYVQDGKIGYIARHPGSASHSGRIYGSGTPSDPFRDYPDVNNPPWKAPRGNGTATSPYSNIATPGETTTLVPPEDEVHVTQKPVFEPTQPQSSEGGALGDNRGPAYETAPPPSSAPAAPDMPRLAQAHPPVHASNGADPARNAEQPLPSTASDSGTEASKDGSMLDRAVETIGAADDKLSAAQDVIGKAVDHVHDEHKPLVQGLAKKVEDLQAVVGQGKEALERAGNARDTAKDVRDRAGEFKNRLDEVTKGTGHIEMDSRSREAIGVVVTGAEAAGQAMHAAIEQTLGKEAAEAVGARDLGKEVSKTAVKTVQDITHQKREIAADPEVRDSLDERTSEERADAEEGQRRLDEHVKEKADRAAKHEQDIKSFR